ncbi:lipase [Photobacterium sanctipauli]|uniref:Lipase n=1 Tax=Photobacterium sanctipauli TaxID=1342794 RepID=A0A2T3NXN5_9GAMM|nr:VolA/Pla-1 family phospholipase [Photobacterium sanctipauli]PSW21063.1 lipase [Photobacterium sanctipauli]
MKKSILALSVAASLALAGCGNDTKVENKVQYEDHILKSLQADTKIVFDVLTDPILPTFMAVDTIDGTLSTEGSMGDDHYSTDLSDPVAALGKTDGWSTTQPIVLPFGGGLNSATIPSAISVIETSDPRAGAPFNIVELQYGVDYLALPVDDSIIIQPTKPLNPKSHYMFAVTDELQDSNGEPVGMSESYAALKTTVQAPSSDLVTAQEVTHLIEGIFASTGMDSKTIIYSSWFTTGSVGETLYATKAAVASGVLSGKGVQSVWTGTANPNNVDLTLAYSISADSTKDYAAALGEDDNFTKYLDDSNGTLKQTLIGLYSATSPGTINVTKGTVKLPYYLETDTNNWNNTPFQSAMPSLAIIANALGDDALAATVTEQLIAAGIDVTKLATDTTEQLKLVGLSLEDADGQPLDAESLITQYSPIPQIKSLEDVPYLLFTPTVAAADGSLPVVIYQHGITSVKENSYAFAANLIAKGIAVLAIDNPHHGDRSLDDDRSANTDIQAYLNLTYLPVARDNIRQSMLDINGLRTALSVTDLTTDDELKLLDSSNVSFLGHSLGGVVGAPAVVAANRTLGLGTPVDGMFSFEKAAFANSGSDIGNLLFGSQAFGSMIKHNLMYSSSKDYQSYADASCTDTSFEGWENICFDNFEAAASDEIKTEMSSTFSSFIYAAQTIIGTADPVNAAWLASNNVAPDGSDEPVNIPMYMLQVKNDDTVPNNVPINQILNQPFAGTEPMADLFGLDSFTSGPAEGGKYFAKFNEAAEGNHSTFIAPSTFAPGAPELITHGVMQAQVGEFFATGKVDTIGNQED